MLQILKLILNNLKKKKKKIASSTNYLGNTMRSWGGFIQKSQIMKSKLNKDIYREGDLQAACSWQDRILLS